MRRTIQPSHSPAPDAMLRFASQVSEMMDRPLAAIQFAIGGEVSDIRRVTMQVVDRTGQNAIPGQDYQLLPSSNRFMLTVRIGTAEWGAPAGTQVVTVTTGTAIKVLTTDQLLWIETDATGKAAIDIEVTGAGTRYVTATVGVESASSGAIAWA